MLVMILSKTPLWVFALFALLIWLGVCQLSVRWVSIHRVWLTPIVFIVWGLSGLVLRNTGSMAALLPWLAAAIVGTLIGLSRRNTLEIDRARSRVMRPGSALPLLRNVVVFSAHYVLNVAAAFHPGQHSIMQADMAVSGLFAGYFVGWLSRFSQHYFATGVVEGGSSETGPRAGESLAH